MQSSTLASRVPGGTAGFRSEGARRASPFPCSLAYDRTTKARGYARAGIPHYWIANLIDRCLEVQSDPDPAASRNQASAVLGANDSAPLPTGGTIVVASLLPPRS